MEEEDAVCGAFGAFMTQALLPAVEAAALKWLWVVFRAVIL